MNSTANSTSHDVAKTYKTLGPMYVAGYSLAFLIYCYTLHRLRKAKITISRNNKESSKMKFYVSCLGVGSALACVILFTCFSAVAPAVPEWQPELSKGEHKFQVLLQGTVYAFAVAFDFHIAGYWMLLMENFVRSTCGLDSKSGARRTKYGKLKKFEPSVLEWGLFVVPPYIGCFGVFIMSILGWALDFRWTLVENVRIICGTMTICIFAFVFMNLHVVLRASSNLKSLAQSGTNGTDNMGSGMSSQLSETGIVKQRSEQKALITLAKRTRNMSYYIAGSCALVAPLAIFVASSSILSMPLGFLVIVTFLQGCLMFWLYVVYFSVLRKIVAKKPSYSQTAMSTFNMGSSFRNATEVETVNISENPMSFKDVIDKIQEDDFDIDSKI